MSDHQHNHEGCDCIDSTKCNCECHVIQAADELAKAAKNARFYTETRNGIEDLELALAAYEKVRGVK